MKLWRAEQRWSWQDTSWLPGWPSTKYRTSGNLLAACSARGTHLWHKYVRRLKKFSHAKPRSKSPNDDLSHFREKKSMQTQRQQHGIRVSFYVVARFEHPSFARICCIFFSSLSLSLSLSLFLFKVSQVFARRFIFIWLVSAGGIFHGGWESFTCIDVKTNLACFLMHQGESRVRARRVSCNLEFVYPRVSNAYVTNKKLYPSKEKVGRPCLLRLNVERQVGPHSSKRR